jgi:hypothetical protein
MKLRGLQLWRQIMKFIYPADQLEMFESCITNWPRRTGPRPVKGRCSDLARVMGVIFVERQARRDALK